MLTPMEQFKDGMRQFVLSEIVLREIHRHLVKQAARAKEAVGDAIAKAQIAEIILDDGHIATL
jgi:hypothetical protein